LLIQQSTSGNSKKQHSFVGQWLLHHAIAVTWHQLLLHSKQHHKKKSNLFKCINQLVAISSKQQKHSGTG